MPDINIPEPVIRTFTDQRWRLNNLYWITDKDGQRVKFTLNWAQEQLVDEMAYLNLVLKARQLGMTTFIQIYMLDCALFFKNTNCGVIADTRPNAERIFREKIKYPYDNLPDAIKAAVPVVRCNTSTLELANNSIIYVGTSHRSGTLQYLHISEFGKICARYPEKAREIVTGALNTIQAGQVAWIESTAEGQEGRFFDLCEMAQAKQRMGERITELDWKFHFYPWWKEPAYSIDPAGVTIPANLARYFGELRELGIELTDGQRAWYAKKAEVQLADMKREYPSTPREAFEAAVEGAYWGELMERAEADGRIGNFPWQPGALVETAWDIGVGDETTIWFWQRVGREFHIIDYYHASGEGAPHYAGVLAQLAKERGYQYGKHWLPHDVKVREWGTGKSRVEQLVDLGVRPTKVPEISVADGINAVRALLPRCWFDAARCSDGIKALKNFRKEWDQDRGIWRDEPRHDWASHGASAFRYLAVSAKDAPAAPPPKPAVKGISQMSIDEMWDKMKVKPTGRL